MFLLLAIWMAKNIDNEVKARYINAINKLPIDFYEIINKSVNEIPRILHFFKDQEICIILGKLIGEWISKEGTFKVK